VVVLLVEPQNHLALQRASFVGFRPQNLLVRFRREPATTHGIDTKGASWRSNFMKRVWPSDQEFLEFIHFALSEWISSMYLGVV
jgi:hypothetical protein